MTLYGLILTKRTSQYIELLDDTGKSRFHVYYEHCPHTILGFKYDIEFTLNGTTGLLAELIFIQMSKEQL